MKTKLAVAALAAGLFLTSPGIALADHDDRRRFHDGWEHRDRWDDRRRHRDPRFRTWDRRYRGGYWDPRFRGGYDWRFDQRRPWGLRPWHNRWYWSAPPYRYRRSNGAAVIGGAIIGATATQLLLHGQGDHRHCDHGLDRSCYRIERDSLGRERRVPLPDTACF